MPSLYRSVRHLLTGLWLAALLSACAGLQENEVNSTPATPVINTPPSPAPTETTSPTVTETVQASEEALPDVQASPAEPAVDPGENAPEVPPAPKLTEEVEEKLIWDRLTAGYALPDQDNPRVQPDFEWYASHPEYLDRVFTRAERYLHLILGEIEQRDMPAEIALLPVVESAFHPFAYSNGRAAGIWQFIPGTGRMYGLKQNWWYDGRRDIRASTRAALDYLSALNRQYQGDWLLALAAYNSGAGTVNKAIRYNQKKGRPTDFWHLKLPQETRGYVPKLLAISRVVLEAKQHQIDLPEIADEPYLEAVDTGGQIDLAMAADLAEVPLDELYWLNPGFNRWATDPKGPHQLLLPVDKSEQFRVKLASLPQNKRIQWKRHQVKDGETLSHIAKRYDTRVELLTDVNDLKGNNIRAGKYLMIPVAAKSLNSYRLSSDQRLHNAQQQPRSGVKQTHIVKSGDTLWDIARAYKVAVGSLAKWNGMAPRDTLRQGQKLVIWTRNSNTSGAASAVNTIRPIRYTVRNGDSLARISDKFNIKVNDLVRWNGLSKQKYLQPGQKLTLYVDVTQQSGSI